MPEQGKTRIRVVGYPMSPPTAGAHYAADHIAAKYGDRFETAYHFSLAWAAFAVELTKDVTFPAELKGHCTSPYVQLETRNADGGVTVVPIGGFQPNFADWCKKTFPDDKELAGLVSKVPGFTKVAHTFTGAEGTAPTAPETKNE